MKRKQSQYWEKIRRKGQSDFVAMKGGIIFGFLGFGLLTSITKFIFGFITHNYSTNFFDRDFQQRILIGLILSIPFGFLFGWLMWHLNEWLYLKQNQSK